MSDASHSIIEFDAIAIKIEYQTKINITDQSFFTKIVLRRQKNHITLPYNSFYSLMNIQFRLIFIFEGREGANNKIK